MAGQETYGFDPAFERAVIALSCSRPRFFGRIGRALDPKMIMNPIAKLALEAAQAIGRDLGRGPSSSVLVIQRLRRWMEEGKVTIEQLRAVGGLLDDADDVGLPPTDETADEVAPLLKRRAQADVVTLAINEYQKRGDFDRVVETLAKAQRVGIVDTSEGIRIGTASFGEIERLRHIKRLPTGVPELDAMLSGGHARAALGVVVGAAGDGKCHAKGQGILMSDGTIRKVEDVCVGDRLIGPDGKVRNVLRTNRGHGELFDVVPLRGGTPWRVNADHVLTLTGSGRYAGEVVDVSLRNWSAWSRQRKHLFKLFHIGVEEFEGVSRVRLPLDPYFLGVLLGDGSLQNDLRITSADSEIRDMVEFECRRFDLRLKVYEHDRAPSYELVGQRGRKNPVREIVRGLGLWGTKSGTKFIPQIYKVGSVAARAALLAGLLDTDGNTNKSGMEFTSKSRQLAGDVAFVSRSLGFAASIAEVEKCCTNTGAVGTYYRVGIWGDGLDLLPLRLERKRPSERRQKKDHHVTGFVVEPVGEGDYYGFSLDRDSRYLLDDFTVTHNSMMLSHIAADALFEGMSVLYATLELPEAEVLARLKANLTGLPINAILDGSMEQAKSRIAELETRLGIGYVQEFTPHMTTVADLGEWVTRCEDTIGSSIDVLIVDYADRLSAPTEKSEYQAMRVVYEELRQLGVDHNCFNWTASQASRQQKGSKRTDLNHVADSMHKVRIADLVITLNVKGEDTDLLEYYIAKHRTGRSRVIVGPLPTEFERGRISPVQRTTGY